MPAHVLLLLVLALALHALENDPLLVSRRVLDQLSELFAADPTVSILIVLREGFRYLSGSRVIVENVLEQSDLLRALDEISLSRIFKTVPFHTCCECNAVFVPQSVVRRSDDDGASSRSDS